MLKKIKIYHLFIALAIFVFGSTLINVINSYSGIPFWDEWDGYLLFYNKIQKGGLELFKAFFEQHNEHKIFFTRIWFYIGFVFFKGDLWVQLIINFLIQLTSLIILSIIVFKQNELEKKYKIILISIIFILGFSYIQNDNFIWGFQSQFLGVYMNAILTYFFIYKFSIKNKTKNLLLSFLFIFLTCFSLGNGVIGVFVAILLILILKIPNKFKIIYSLFCILCIYLYLFNFKEVEGHSSIKDSLFNHFYEVLRYFIRFLGAPFKIILNFENKITDLLGFLSIFLYLFAIIIFYKKKNKNNKILIILALITFIFITGFVTSLGRIRFSLDHAINSHYQTPVLIYWLCLFIFYYVEIDNINFRKQLILFFILLFPFLILKQIVFKDFDEENLNKKREFLAFRMGVKTDYFIYTLYPFHLDTLKYLDLITNKITAFKEPYISIINNNLNNYKIKNDPNSIIGILDTNRFKMASDTNYYFIRGFAYNSKNNIIPDAVILKIKNEIIGYGLFKNAKKKIENFDTNRIEDFSKFEGFVKNTIKNNKVELLFLFNDTIYYNN